MSGFNKILSWIVATSVGYSALVIIILHIIQPDKNPAVNAISEYVNGAFGDLMISVFFIQSIGAVALAMLVLRIGPKGWKIYFGSTLFIFSALGDVVAGLFPADPVTVEVITSTGMIHAAGGLTRFISLAIALPILSSVLSRGPWQLDGRLLKILGILFVISLIGTIFILAPLGFFGLGQRFFIGTVLVWMFVVGASVIRKKQKRK